MKFKNILIMHVFITMTAQSIPNQMDLRYYLNDVRRSNENQGTENLFMHDLTYVRSSDENQGITNLFMRHLTELMRYSKSHRPELPCGGEYLNRIQTLLSNYLLSNCDKSIIYAIIPRLVTLNKKTITYQVRSSILNGELPSECVDCKEGIPKILDAILSAFQGGQLPQLLDILDQSCNRIQSSTEVIESLIMEKVFLKGCPPIDTQKNRDCCGIGYVMDYICSWLW